MMVNIKARAFIAWEEKLLAGKCVEVPATQFLDFLRHMAVLYGPHAVEYRKISPTHYEICPSQELLKRWGKQ